MKYLKNKSWDEITREERFFCAQLFFELRKDVNPFLELLHLPARNYEVGFEVCFYRDLMKEKRLSIRNSLYPQKRTFDLALFAEDEIVIIEAKAQQGFHADQLDDFRKDRLLIRSLIGNDNNVSIRIIGIYSSEYSPSEVTLNAFDQTTTWKRISKLYPTSKETFSRADSSYSR